ncbi:MAG: FMN-binding negative transcriptional regulator [Pseudomonadota bacterium]
MYQPAPFREATLSLQQALMRDHPLGLLISNAPDGPVADPVPFLLDAEASPQGTLRGHVARANPHWRHLDAPDARALVVFQGPQAYVTPAWYATKRETGKVVPTWNYVVVQARGPVRVIHDTGWLRAQVDALTTRQEGGRPEPWAVSDAPERFVENQLRAIVGLEITIDSIDGKWKVSQNRPLADRVGVAEGLVDAAAEMARLVDPTSPADGDGDPSQTS